MRIKILSPKALSQTASTRKYIRLIELICLRNISMLRDINNMRTIISNIIRDVRRCFRLVEKETNLRIMDRVKIIRESKLKIQEWSCPTLMSKINILKTYS